MDAYHTFDRLPRLIADLTIEEVHDEILLFRTYGKDVLALTPQQTALFRLCQSGASLQAAKECLGDQATYEGLTALREMRLFAPSRLPNSAAVQHWIACEVGSETLVYKEHHAQAILLDPVTSQVWKMCDGVTQFEIALHNLKNHFQTSEPAAEELLWAALSHLRQHGLLVLALPAPMSRREFGKRWAAAAALFPILASASVPTPSAAASPSCASCVLSGGCAAAVPGRPGVLPVCCTFDPTPPCPARGFPTGNSTVCVRSFNITGSSCLDDTLDPSPSFCNVINDRAPGNPQGGNAIVACANARANAIVAGFAGYQCAQCP